MGKWRISHGSLTFADAHLFAELIGPIVAKGKGINTLEAISDQFLRGDSSFWFYDHEGFPRSILITQVVSYPSGLKVLDLDYAAGSLGDLVEFFEGAQELAKKSCCHRIRTTGRAGWKRALESAGIEGISEVSRTFELEV